MMDESFFFLFGTSGLPWGQSFSVGMILYRLRERRAGNRTDEEALWWKLAVPGGFSRAKYSIEDPPHRPSPGLVQRRLGRRVWSG